MRGRAWQFYWLLLTADAIIRREEMLLLPPPCCSLDVAYMCALAALRCCHRDTPSSGALDMAASRAERCRGGVGAQRSIFGIGF